MVCPRCGKAVSLSAGNYCPSCGAGIAVGVLTPPPPTGAVVPFDHAADTGLPPPLSSDADATTFAALGDSESGTKTAAASPDPDKTIFVSPTPDARNQPRSTFRTPPPVGNARTGEASQDGPLAIGQSF